MIKKLPQRCMILGNLSWLKSFREDQISSECKHCPWYYSAHLYYRWIAIRVNMIRWSNQLSHGINPWCHLDKSKPQAIPTFSFDQVHSETMVLIGEFALILLCFAKCFISLNFNTCSAEVQIISLRRSLLKIDWFSVFFKEQCSSITHKTLTYDVFWGGALSVYDVGERQSLWGSRP